MVTGPNYRDWITSEFPLLDPEWNQNGESADTNPTDTDRIDEEVKSPCKERASVDTERDILTLNENVDTNKNAIAVLEGSVLKVLQAITIQREINEEMNKKLTEKLHALEKKYDDKLILYKDE